MNATARKKPLSPVTRTKALFTSSFVILYPSMSNNAAERAWRDVRAQIELEEISDLAQRMGRVGLAIVAKQEKSPPRGRV